MPRPTYLICAQGVSVHPETNLLSLFNIVEIVQATLVPVIDGKPVIPESAKLSIPTFQVVSVWIAEEGDLGKNFEFQFWCSSPKGLPLFHSDIATFIFAARSHRLITDPVIPQGYPELGTYTIEARIRKLGDKDWITQKYSFIVMERPKTPAPEDSSSPER
jgi:hypothetical protein